jgi:hypothetical protein
MYTHDNAMISFVISFMISQKGDGRREFRGGKFGQKLQGFLPILRCACTHPHLSQLIG